MNTNKLNIKYNECLTSDNTTKKTDSLDKAVKGLPYGLPSILRFYLQYVGVLYDERGHAEQKFRRHALHQGYEDKDIMRCIQQFRKENINGDYIPEYDSLDDSDFDNDGIIHDEAFHKHMERAKERLGSTIDGIYTRFERRKDQKMKMNEVELSNKQDSANKFLERLKKRSEDNKKQTDREQMLNLIDRLKNERDRLEKWMKKYIIEQRCRINGKTPYSATLTVIQAKELVNMMAKLNASVHTEMKKLISPFILEYKPKAEKKDVKEGDKATDGDGVTGITGNNLSKDNNAEAFHDINANSPTN